MDARKSGDIIVSNKNYFNIRGIVGNIYEFTDINNLLYQNLVKLRKNITHKYVNEKPSVVFDTYLRKKKIQKLLNI